MQVLVQRLHTQTHQIMPPVVVDVDATMLTLVHIRDCMIRAGLVLFQEEAQALWGSYNSLTATPTVWVFWSGHAEQHTLVFTVIP